MDESVKILTSIYNNFIDIPWIVGISTDRIDQKELIVYVRCKRLTKHRKDLIKKIVNNYKIRFIKLNKES